MRRMGVRKMGVRKMAGERWMGLGGGERRMGGEEGVRGGWEVRRG